MFYVLRVKVHIIISKIFRVKIKVESLILLGSSRESRSLTLSKYPCGFFDLIA